MIDEGRKADWFRERERNRMGKELRMKSYESSNVREICRISESNNRMEG